MMNIERCCPVCEQSMKLKEHIKSEKNYKILRLFCCGCGYEETLFGDNDKSVEAKMYTKKELSFFKK